MKKTDKTFPFYPEINISGDDVFYYSTTIRIYRNGLWYDLEIADVYDTQNASERFKDLLISTKLYWEPSEKGSNAPYNPPSKNQEDTIDDLLDDQFRIKRIKNTHNIFKP